MKLLVAFSSRYLRTPDGKIWTRSSYDSDMWHEAQQAFEEINVLARVRPVAAVPEGARPADGPGIHYYSLPEWNSWKAPFYVRDLHANTKRAVQNSHAVLLHSPSPEAELAFIYARKFQKPVSIECRGEAVMSGEYWRKRGVVPAGLLAQYFTRQFRKHMNAAWGCVFVAEQLQKKYSFFLKNGLRSEVISDIRIPDQFFTAPRFKKGSTGERVKAVNVGRLEAQKDQATLIKAYAMLDKMGLGSWELHLVGEGPLRESLERLALALQVKEKVIFHGFVPWGEKLFHLLDEMDIFVLSSINEGMPRVLIEAMARGLPCISTDVSGAGELLGTKNIIPCGRVDLLAARVAEIISSPQRLDKLSQACWLRAQDFKLAGLRERKIQFLRTFAEYVKT